MYWRGLEEDRVVSNHLHQRTPQVRQCTAHYGDSAVQRCHRSRTLAFRSRRSQTAPCSVLGFAELAVASNGGPKRSAMALFCKSGRLPMREALRSTS
jgi:hypothetical protein